MSAPSDFEAWEVDLHGHRAVYREVGSGPPVVLIHGMVNSSRHWREMALRLAANHRVIAPDLIGHGDSATPRGDYSLGAHSAAIRDLLISIGVHRASFVGHSLGGGVAMQFFWQFPERVERLALISSGGLGPEVSPLLRAAALPGASALVAAAAHPKVLSGLVRLAVSLEGRGRPQLAIQLRAVARALGPLEGSGGRVAFLETLRSVIDVRGQRVSANDRLYLLAPVPTLIAWGDRDRTIPPDHGRAARDLIPDARFETIVNCAHFPHLEQPAALAELLVDFIGSTVPHAIDEEELIDLIGSRTTRRHLRAA